VAEICVDGELDTSEALVLDEVGDGHSMHAAHVEGRPVVVRASSPEAVKEALARPEVSCVLVPAERRDLLELDLTELTYG